MYDCINKEGKEEEREGANITEDDHIRRGIEGKGPGRGGDNRRVGHQGTTSL